MLTKSCTPLALQSMGMTPAALVEPRWSSRAGRATLVELGAGEARRGSAQADESDVRARFDWSIAEAKLANALLARCA